MEKHVIQEQMRNFPGINYYPGKNKLEIAGRSIPENPEAVYKKLDSWITGHFEKNSSLNISFELEYINSGSSKHLFEILKRLTSINRTGKRVNMKWMYEEDDEAIYELGIHYRDNAGIPLDLEMVK